MLPRLLTIARFAETLDRCPQCQAERENRSQVFCEVCGFNFKTLQPGVPASVPVPVSEPPRPADPMPVPAATPERVENTKPAAVRWDVVIAVDPNLNGEPNPDAPANRPEQMFTLFDVENIIGRATLGVRLQVPVVGDGGISRRHAMLRKTDSAGLSVRDLGSANGTQLNGVDLVPGVESPLKNGDTLSLGAWSRITVRAVQL